MRTELARVQTDAQMKSFERNGYEEYEFLALGSSACDVCRALDGKHFKVKDMLSGENAPPMHPNCRCSTAAYIDDKTYEDWLNFLEKGGTTEEWKSFDEYDKIRKGNSYLIPREKITNYILDSRKKHFKEFQNVGYTPQDVNLLTEDILEQFIHNPSFARRDDGKYESTFAIKMMLGKTEKKVYRTVWKITDGGASSFVTAYRDRSLDE